MALWSCGAHVASILFLTMASFIGVEGSPGYVVCYYSSWAHYRQGLAKYTVEDIPVELCTHLIYAFATLDSKTFLAKPFDKWLDIDLKNYEKFVQLKKKNPKMKVLIGVGGWNDSRSTKYSRMVADASKRRKFVEEVVKLLLQYGFDGLDLDWEYPAYESRSEDKEGFTKWVEDLKTALTPHDLLLTSAVSASRRTIDRGYDIPKIAKHLDFINLMSYDFHGSWERVVAHHSPLFPEAGQNPEFNSDFAVNYWIKKGMPAEKVILGVPLYGRSWTLAGANNSPGSAARGAGKRSKYVKESGHMAYYECCLAHQEDGWTKITGEGGPYLTKGDQWVGYDDIDAVVKKADYARNKGLGGIMVWDIVSDDFNNACGHGPNPLLTAIWNTLEGNPPPPTETPTFTTKPSPTTTSRPPIWSRGNSWKAQPSGGGSSFSQGNFNAVGGTSSVKGSSGSSSSSTSKLPYEWLEWPIFSQSPQVTSNSISNSGSSSVTPSPTPKTTRGPYEWESWPIFNQNPEDTQNSISSSGSSSSVTRPPSGITTSHKGSSGSSTQTNDGPYHWQSWPIFNKPPQNSQNSISSSNSGSSVTTPSKTSSTTPFQSSLTSGGSSRGSSQTTKRPYHWQSWPIFNKSPQDSQNSISSSSSGSSFTTPSTTSSTTRFQSSFTSQVNQGSSGSSSVFTQTTTKRPYDWQSWPIFNKNPENTQNSISSSDSGSASFTTPSTTTSTRFQSSFISQFSTSRGTSNTQDSNGSGSGSSQTTKGPYNWQSWPIFNKSPESSQNTILPTDSESSPIGTTPPTSSSTRFQSSFTSRFSKPEETTNSGSSSGSDSRQTTYAWQSWPVFRKSSGEKQNSISSFRSQATTTTLAPSSFSSSKLPISVSLFSSSSAASSWFDDCKVIGFAPDPASCSAFYRCTGNQAYRFNCPGGLLWSQDESSCDWPDSVQCL